MQRDPFAVVDHADEVADSHLAAWRARRNATAVARKRPVPPVSPPAAESVAAEAPAPPEAVLEAGRRERLTRAELLSEDGEEPVTGVRRRAVIDVRYWEPRPRGRVRR